MRIPLLALALTVLPASFGLAQNEPLSPKALLENEQITVREIRMAPGAAQPATTRPNTFLYALTDGAIVFTPPGRTGYELTFKAGEALWLPSQETATANETDKEVRALVVEIKARPASARRVPVADKAGKGSKPGKAGKAGGAKRTTKKPPAKN